MARGGPSLPSQALACIGKNWSKSSLTREKLLCNVKELANFAAKTFGLEKITSLGPKHIEAYVKSLHERNLSASTMADKLTACRTVAVAIGKSNIVKGHNREYGVSRCRINPQDVSRDKTSEIREILNERAANGDRVAMMMLAAVALRDEFALRAKESLMSTKLVEKNGRVYLVVEGAKGGRTREIPLETDGQLKAVQLVAEVSSALGSTTGRIIPPELTLKQAYHLQRNEWRALGGTRANGANMHGARHLFARDSKAHGKTNAEIMHILGHGEERSGAPYGI